MKTVQEWRTISEQIHISEQTITAHHGELLLWISKRLHGNLVQFHLGVAGQAHAVETFGEK